MKYSKKNRMKINKNKVIILGYATEDINMEIENIKLQH